MPTSASNSGRGQKISLPTCLPSNRRSWRHEEAHHRLKHNSRENNTDQSSLALLVFVMLRAHADTGQRRWDLSDSFRISSHVSIEDVLFLPAVFMKKG